MVMSVKILQMCNCASTWSKSTCGCDIQIVESFSVTAFWHCEFETVIEEMGGTNRFKYTVLGEQIGHTALIIMSRKSFCYLLPRKFECFSTAFEAQFDEGHSSRVL
ncbi:hypothetical protein T10_4849 [Trichinella papuae]|uniref:Uncharacterized protein n=1 Tax=Trichinella papuae TaxID=268474 RepID=A0A0V1M1V9_9BILA|nr:hypothetical protein T10_4849 [Trichinella papuae]